MPAISSVMGALKYLPASLARQALAKANPKFNSYFSKALSYGIDADRALSYLTDRFESDSQRDYRQGLEKGAANQTLRPDEMVSRSQMKNQEIPGNALRKVAAIGLGGALGYEPNQEISQDEDQQVNQIGQNPQNPQNPPNSPMTQQEGLKRYYSARGQPQSDQMNINENPDASLIAALEKILKM